LFFPRPLKQEIAHRSGFFFSFLRIKPDHGPRPASPFSFPLFLPGTRAPSFFSLIFPKAAFGGRPLFFTLFYRAAGRSSTLNGPKRLPPAFPLLPIRRSTSLALFFFFPPFPTFREQNRPLFPGVKTTHVIFPLNLRLLCSTELGSPFSLPLGKIDEGMFSSPPPLSFFPYPINNQPTFPLGPAGPCFLVCCLFFHISGAAAPFRAIKERGFFLAIIWIMGTFFFFSRCSLPLPIVFSFPFFFFFFFSQTSDNGLRWMASPPFFLLP